MAICVLSLLLVPFRYKRFSSGYSSFLLKKTNVSKFQFPLVFNPSLCLMSPFHLSYVAVSRPCRLSEFYPNRASQHDVVSYIHFIIVLSLFYQLVATNQLEQATLNPETIQRLISMAELQAPRMRSRTMESLQIYP